MLSKASIAGHPIHPMLIAFPIAFLVGSFFVDLFAFGMADPEIGEVGSGLVIAGIVCGLVAAVPGLIDYLSVVPPESSAKKRATLHMAVNSIALLCFAIGWFMRADPDTPTIVSLSLSALGLVFLGSGGWLGGTLVYRNQIGIDHRYADAGKWSELSMHGDTGHWIPVARVGELKPNQMKLVHINEQRVVIACHEHGYTAFDDHCTHRGGSLADGVLIAGTVQCPWHGSQFDAHTGQCVAGPAEQNIHTWDVRTENGQVLLRVDKRFVETYRPEEHERASATMQ